MRAPLASPALLLLLSLIRSDAAALTDPAWKQAAIGEFNERVEQYVELHRSLAPASGAGQMCADPEQIHQNAAALARDIRVARPDPVREAIFTPAAARFFREHIAGVLRDHAHDVAAILEEMAADDIEEFAPVEPYQTFPWGTGNVMWPSMLWRLPPLPQELEYRFVGPDLVLLDVSANLIVDVLERALEPFPEHDGDTPPPATPNPRGHAPCDVHPELPACWL